MNDWKDVDRPWWVKEFMVEKVVREEMSPKEISEEYGEGTKGEANTIARHAERHDVGPYGEEEERSTERNPVSGVKNTDSPIADPDLELFDPEYLEEQYWYEGRSTPDLGDELGVGSKAVQYWMKEHGIPIRTPRDALHLRLGKTDIADLRAKYGLKSGPVDEEETSMWRDYHNLER